MIDHLTVNRVFYDALWSKAHLQRPEHFNTWPLVKEWLPEAPVRLEVGPGLRPRLPIAGTHFVDISAPAIARLSTDGGLAAAGEISALPFADNTFDLVCAFDVIEHVEDEQRVFSELTRVLKNDAVLIFSVPLHAHLWTEFDDWVGHARRYEPQHLLDMTAHHRLRVLKSAAFGMQPASPRLVRYGMSWLRRRPTWAMFWYNWVGMPIATRFQKQLRLDDGVVDAGTIAEIIVVCRRSDVARLAAN